MPIPMGRAKGQGTVVPITPSPTGRPRWRVAVTMADGRRVWRTAYSEREAERLRAALVEARELDLDPSRQTLEGFLRSWIAGLRDAKHQPDWRYFGLVFVTERGDPYHPSYVLHAFRRACDAAGIPRRRVHDLRGTHATLLRASGVTEDTRMARLGHSTTTMARHYAKASIDQDQAAADLMDEAM
jgi:integrase